MLNEEALRSGIRWIWPSVPGTCESVHCLNERALPSSPNRNVFSLKCCWNGPIKLRSNRHWSFASTKGNRYEIPRTFQKTVGITFLADFTVFFWSWFIRWSPLFWLFLRLGCEVMDPCFVYSNESTQKFIWITLKHLQTLFWNRYTVALIVYSEQTRHPSCR